MLKETCGLCGKPLGEESVSCSDGTNDPVRVCMDCAPENPWKEQTKDVLEQMREDHYDFSANTRES